MKNILYIITTNSFEDAASLISAHDSIRSHGKVLFVQEGVRCSPLPSFSCHALLEDLVARDLQPTCPTIEYPEMVKVIFESDLVITI